VDSEEVRPRSLERKGLDHMPLACNCGFVLDRDRDGALDPTLSTRFGFEPGIRLLDTCRLEATGLRELWRE